MRNIPFICVNNPLLLNNSQFRVGLGLTGPAQPHLHRNEPGVGEEGPGDGQRQADGRQPVGPVGPELFVYF